MREYINGFLQEKLIKNQVTYSESLICMHILDFINSGKMTREIVGNEVYYWVNYDKIASDLAILGIKKQAISDIMIYSLSEKPSDWDKRLEGMSESTRKKKSKSKFIGLFKRYTKKDSEGTYSYFAPTKKLYDMLGHITENDDDMKLKKEKAPTQKADAKHKKTNNNNICTYEQYYTQDSEKSKEEIKNNEVDDNEIMKLLKENKITGINKSDAIKTFTDIDKLMFCLKKITIKTYAYLKATYTTKSTYMSSKKKNTFDNFDNTISDYTDDIFERANRAKWENKDKEARRKYTQKSEFV